jgi:hypothetical protein
MDWIFLSCWIAVVLPLQDGADWGGKRVELMAATSAAGLSNSREDTPNLPLPSAGVQPSKSYPGAWTPFQL